MSTPTDDGGPTFPQTETKLGNPMNSEHGPQVGGMSLLDYYAGQALQGLIADGFYERVKNERIGRRTPKQSIPSLAAGLAYEYAAEMIKARTAFHS